MEETAACGFARDENFMLQSPSRERRRSVKFKKKKAPIGEANRSGADPGG